MYTIYRMNTNELDNRFLRALKATFKDKEIEIAICEASQAGEDETSYLLKSPGNRDHLLKAIENIAENQNLISVNLDQVR